jgi:sugar/nucleoside kinase (ribokinase family)
MKRVVVAGELNVDLIFRGEHAEPRAGTETLADEFHMTLGSASAICASALARLGTSVAFAGRVGRDAWGDHCIVALMSAGVDVRRVVRDAGVRTGITVSITSPRERALVTFTGTSQIAAEDLDDRLLDGIDHVHVSSFFLQPALRAACADLFTRATGRGCTTSLDPGFDPAKQWDGGLRDVLRHTDLFFPNEIELARIAGHADAETALRALDNGRTHTVAKLGRDGCMTLVDAQPLRIPAFAVDAVDTTGAGDSFNAGYLHGFLRGLAPRDCLRYGAACGALSTRGLGGTTSQPTLHELEQFLSSADRAIRRSGEVHG